MMRITFLALALMFTGSFVHAESNSMDDTFAVRKIDNGQALLSGKIKSLKTGDFLYFVRPPYEFKVVSVDDDLDEVVVALPGKHDLKPGNALIRNPTERIKKFLATESRLKEALAE